MTVRGRLAAYYAQALADESRPPVFRLFCAQYLAHLALADWDSQARRRKDAARAAGAALLRVLETMPLQSGCPPVDDGGQPGTPGECEGPAGVAADGVPGQ